MFLRSLGLLSLCFIFMNGALAKKVFPLVLPSGEVIQDIDSWNSRKIQIKDMLQNEMYGYRPMSPQKEFKIVQDYTLLDKALRYQEILISFKEERITRNIRLALFSPLSKPKGVFLTLNRCGNHTMYPFEGITKDEEISVHPNCFKKNALERGAHASKVSVDLVTQRGYALATFAEGYIDADDPRIKDDGISPQLIPIDYRNKITMGHLMAWSWGLSQVIDLFKSDVLQISDIPVIAIGHSRRGKAALLTGAFDGRVDVTIAHQSGMGGTARIRGASFPFRETAHYMFKKNSVVYNSIGDKSGLGHFFARVFKKKSKRPNSLNFDAHFLTSLVAPRKLLDVQGNQDNWAGPKASWTTIRKTFPVYELYGLSTPKKSVSLGLATELLEAHPIMQVTRDTKHQIDEDYWKLFLSYTDLVLN